MDSNVLFSISSAFAQIMIIFYGVLLLLGGTSLYLFIKLAIRGIKALDIYLDEKGNGRK